MSLAAVRMLSEPTIATSCSIKSKQDTHGFQKQDLTTKGQVVKANIAPAHICRRIATLAGLRGHPGAPHGPGLLRRYFLRGKGRGPGGESAPALDTGLRRCDGSYY